MRNGAIQNRGNGANLLSIRRATRGGDMADKRNKPLVQLPKDALSRVRLGDVFAERDSLLLESHVFVPTPAFSHAIDPKSARCFYVGRRGTGKTAITLYVTSSEKHVQLLHPQLLVPE